MTINAQVAKRIWFNAGVHQSESASYSEGICINFGENKKMKICPKAASHKCDQYDGFEPAKICILEGGRNCPYNKPKELIV